jgi:hypothetical protein
MITISTRNEDNYFLPEDGTLARQRLLQTLSLPSDAFISCYGFTLQEAYDAILEVDAKGFKQSLLLDYSQGVGPTAKPKIKNLIQNLKNGQVVLTTAGPKSAKTSSIFHVKGLVKYDPEKNKVPYCVEGSTNISISGFYQSNTMRFFKNKLWSETFIAQHKEIKDWALKNLPHYQPSVLADNFDIVDYFFDNYVEEKDNEFLI